MSIEKVYNVFKKSGEPMRPGEVVKESKLEKSDVSKAIKELKEQGKIFSPKRCFYQVK